LATDPADRIAKVNKELETTRSALKPCAKKTAATLARSMRDQTGRRDFAPPDRRD
jgi:hypothetical protein